MMTTAQNARPRLACVGHHYAAPYNRARLTALARHFQVLCLTVAQSALRSLGLNRDGAGELRREVGLGGEEVVELPLRGRAGNVTQLWLAGLGGELGRFQPDIVLCDAEPWSILRWQAWRATRRRAPQAAFVDFSWENLRRSGLKGRVLDLAYRGVARSADGIIVGNRAARRLMLQAGADFERIWVDGQNGVQGGAGQNRPPQDVGGTAAGAPRVVGYCGRLVPEKGLIELVEAIARLRARHDVRLHLLGSGPLEAELRGRGLPWLTLLPPVTHAEVQEVLRGFDALVLPSKRLDTGGELWEEQFGHVLIEAMAERVATFGSRSGGIPEVLEPFPEALFEPGSASDLARVLEPFLADESRLEALAGAQRDWTGRHWSHESLALRTRDSLLAARAHRQSNRPVR